MIGYADELARRCSGGMMVRLVKGAYWDTEIKRAQERGLDGYPVFTRKAMTDLNYIACAGKLLALRPRIFPQFATHNALTVATVLELADGEGGFEFQRLHGMGEALYAQLSEDHPELAYRTYAPVGSHRDLLAYLVRRLLENGANSSFVAIAADDAVPVATLLRRPADIVGAPENARHPNIPLPRDLYQPQRQNSRGIEFGERAALNELWPHQGRDGACFGGIAYRRPDRAARRARSSARSTRRPIGSVIDATPERASRRWPRAEDSRRWSRHRPRPARMLENAADLLERRARAFHRAAAARRRQDAG